jgi:hypothetical protein
VCTVEMTAVEVHGLIGHGSSLGLYRISIGKRPKINCKYLSKCKSSAIMTNDWRLS